MGDLQLKLEDFLPGYTHFGKKYEEDLFNIYDDEPESSFYRKKEFYTNKLGPSEKKPDKPGMPLKNQLTSARFLSPNTLNDEILLFDGLGSGKTCTAITIAEESRKINPSLKPTLCLMKGPPLKRNFVQELAFKCTSGKFIPDNYDNLTKGEKILRMNRLINKEYDIQTFETFAERVSKYSEKYINKVYSNRVIIIDEVHNIRIQPKKKKGKTSVNIYDSIHRFLHNIDNRKIVLLSATPMRDRPEEFGSVMNLILPEDKQLPTGKEFMKKFFSDDKENNTLENVHELKEAIRGRVGYIRSMEGGVTKVFKGELYGKMEKIKIYPSEMSDFQTKAYVTAYNKDTGDKEGDVDDIEEVEDETKSQGLYSKSRQASLFVFPDGSSGGSSSGKTKDGGKKESTGFGEYFNEVGSEYIMSKDLRNELTSNGKATPYQIIKNISKYSSIYASTIKEILDHPNENIFVYNKYVQGSGGILFAELLKLVGFERTRGHIDMDRDDEYDVSDDEKSDSDMSDIEEETDEDIDDDEPKPPKIDKKTMKKYKKSEDVEIPKKTKKKLDSRKKPRFSLITGETVSAAEIDRVVDKVFNDPRNRYGQYIQVIIGSQVIGEGKSLRNVRQIHIQTPHWNNPETEQAIGRGIRAFSHEDLKPDERSVKIFRHASIPNRGVESINYIMYKTSEDKDFKMKQIERVCKEEAVNCALNWERNNLPTDKDGSKECDYMKCKYTCSHISKKTIANPDLIDDTYNLFYAESEIESITNIIKQMFRKKFAYDLGEMLLEFSETSTMVIVRALKKIIDKSILIINKYGMPSYMREDHNLYFLVDDITLPDSFLLARYAEHPNVKTYYNFEDMIKLAQYRYIVEDKVYLIENYTEADDKKVIIDQIVSLVPSLQELFIEMSVVGNKLEKKTGEEIRTIIVDHYKNYIIDVSNKTVSTLLHDTEGRLRCLPTKGKSMDDWVECDDKVSEEIEDVKIEEKGTLELNPYGYYGRIIKDPKKKFKFQIMKVEKDKTDKRKRWRGPICREMVPKERIIDIINDLNKKSLNIKPPIEVVMKDRNKFIDEIIKRGSEFKKKTLKEMTDDRLKNVYYWQVKAGKKDMCDAMEDWFKEKKLMEYEK
ncbi:MAG: SNF2-related protein [Candidatus Colwellbacteria bacterium]|nr:SNF2-related protein [Candidatus Colwellbacteria bacterium]